MKTRFIASALAGAVATVSISIASAQAPPMDMSWALHSQTYLWNRGNAVAAATAQACYNAMLQARMRGYMGPLDCGANQQTLQNSINRLNQAQQDYNYSQMYNSWRRDNAVGNWDLGALRGQPPVYRCYWYNGRQVCGYY